MNKQDLESLFIPKLPDAPGVYLFKKGKDLLYVGKATSLKQRVRSYFSNDLMKTRGRLLVDMITLADKVEFQATDSVLEALILEAHLIKKNQPKYNTKDKDNKSYNYVVITEEEYPKVLVVRGRLLEQSNQDSSKQNLYRDIFGPYPHGGELKEALKLVRKIFPFRDKCIPFVEKDGQGSMAGVINTNPRPCFNRMIGLCPGVCTGEISKKDYGVQIKNIKMFFEGKKPALLNSLKKQMTGFAKEKEFEKANKIKKTIFALNHIQDVSLIKNISEEIYETEVGKSKGIRIEAYDIAHLSGKNMVGAMVVMENGELKSDQYRKFIINNFDKANDPGALEEMINRRIAHKEWRRPDIVVLDGNEIQLKRAREAWSKSSGVESVGNTPNQDMLFCSVVKDTHHKPKDILFFNKKAWKGLDIKYKEQIIKINADAHRFAIAFHKNRRAKNFI